MEVIEGEGEELGDVGLLRGGAEREEASDCRRVLRRIVELHDSELQMD